MTKIKIDKDIPIPKARNSYPFTTMEVGDSFCTAVPVVNMSGTVNYYNHKWPNRKFITRTSSSGGSRVWRTK